jgi:predicted RNase H-like nuclease (RuvC/YqgF family)
MWHLKDKGLVIGVKKQGQSAHKYYLTTEKPTLDGQPLDITPKKRKYTKRKAVKRVAKVEKVVEVESPRKNYVRELEEQIQRLVQNISNLELAMSEKEKETWILESEIHDLKAIIRYLESKLPKGDR